MQAMAHRNTLIDFSSQNMYPSAMWVWRIFNLYGTGANYPAAFVCISLSHSLVLFLKP